MRLRGDLKGPPIWIFAGHIKAPPGLLPGTQVRLVSKEGRFLGSAFYNPHTTVALRFFPGVEKIDASFLKGALARARELRQMTIGRQEAYRLCHAEGDGLSGLVVDVYGDCIVVAPQSAGWLYLIDDVVASLMSLFPESRVLLRPDRRVEEREKADFSIAGRHLKGPDSVTIHEHGIAYTVDLGEGHKTGFFCDQRAHRAEVARLSRGREVLDVCCYTGGFALNAAKGGASKVHAVDLDEKAIAVAKENAKMNKARVDFEHADAFDMLREWKKVGRQADMVILDPPKFAGSREDLGRAKRSYLDLNALGIAAVRPGGTLVTCSCSGLLSEEEFMGLLIEASRQTGRDLQIFKVGGADADHPFTASFPEGRYLKVVYARVR